MNARILQAVAAIVFLLGVGAFFGASPPPASTTTLAEASRFLVQHICQDGRPPLHDCAAEPARPGAQPYRRVDWSGAQISDALLLPDGSVAQTFDFAGAGEAFDVRDPGDGGDAIRIGPWGVAIYLTQDPGGGRQYMHGVDCPAGGGWLLWRDTPRAAWADATVQISMTRGATDCPTRWGWSYTRWRLADMAWAWRDDRGAAGEVTRATIVSEHYGGRHRETAGHMERFFFAERLGKVRWERWEHRGYSTMDNLDTMAAATATRCPAGPEPPPGADWVRIDCRHWLNFQLRAGASISWP